MKETSTSAPDLLKLYRQMYRSRVFENKVIELWDAGLISGEMHMGLGEEAVVAGTVDHLQDGDGMALDHRGTPPLIMRGTDPRALLYEFLGNEGGICRGFGGHMHLFNRSPMAASSGIVGASGPLANGFALAFQYLDPGKLALAYFGEGALNQGALLESFNLAAVWKLPVIFVCKDSTLAITTVSSSVTGGRIADRINGFGIPVSEVDGLDVEAVWQTGAAAFRHVRSGKGPYFILARCVHQQGHFLGKDLLNVVKHPAAELKRRTGPLLKSILSKQGTGLSPRLKGLKTISHLAANAAQQGSRKVDPIQRTREKLSEEKEALAAIEKEIEREIEEIAKDVISFYHKGAVP